VPTAAFVYDGELVLWDGSTSYWQVGGDDDDGTDIESHVILGPFRFGDARDYGMIQVVQGLVDTSGSVTWNVIVSDTAQGACDDAKAAVDAYVSGDTTTAATYVKFSGTWSDGRSYVSHPRVRGMWTCLWLRSTDKWAFESIALEASAVGGWR